MSRHLSRFRDFRGVLNCKTDIPRRRIMLDFEFLDITGRSATPSVPCCWKPWWRQRVFAARVYRAANWIHVGQTCGRGRMDRENKAQGHVVKDIYVYPLVRDSANAYAAISRRKQIQIFLEAENDY